MTRPRPCAIIGKRLSRLDPAFALKLAELLSRVVVNDREIHHINDHALPTITTDWPELLSIVWRGDISSWENKIALALPHLRQLLTQLWFCKLACVLFLCAPPFG